MLTIQQYREKYPEVSEQYPDDERLASVLYQSEVLNKQVIPSITPFDDWRKQFLGETPQLAFSDRAIQNIKQAGYEATQVQTGILETAVRQGVNFARGLEDIANAPYYYLGKSFGPEWMKQSITRDELEKQAVRESTNARIGTLFGVGDLVGGSKVKGKPKNILELVKLQQEEGKYKGTLKDFLNDKAGLMTVRGRVTLADLPDSFKEALLNNTVPDSQRELSNFDVELVRPESTIGSTASLVTKDVVPLIGEILGTKVGIVDKVLKAPQLLKKLDNKITTALKASGKEGFLVQRAKGIGTSIQKSAREFPSLTLAGEIVGQTQLDPYEDRLANILGDMISKDQYFGDDLIEFLYTEETDSEIEARLKMALENVFVYGAASGIQAGLGATYQSAIAVLQTIKKGSQALKGQFGKRLGDEYVKSLTSIVDEQGNLTKEQIEEVMNLTSNQTWARKFLNNIILPVFRQGAKSKRMAEGERQYITSKRAIEQEAYNLTDALDKEIDQLLYKVELGIDTPGFKFKTKEEAWEYIGSLITDDYRKFGILTSKRFEAPVTQSEGFRKAIASLPEQIQANIIKSRNLVDDLSTKLLNSNVVSPEIKAIIQDNIGRYLNTSYKFYTNPNWTPSQEVQDNFVKYLLKSKSVANEIEARDYINQILKGRENEDLIGTFSTTIKRLNDKLFLEKKELPKELEDFLGKINNPNFRIYNTVSKLAHWTQMDKLFSQLKQSGENVLYFSDEQRSKLIDIARNVNTREGQRAQELLNNMTARLGADPVSDIVPRFGELQGYWTTPIIKKSLSETASYTRNLLDAFADTKFGAAWLKFRHLGNMNNTVGNNITHERNFAAGPIFLAANGTVPTFTELGNSARIIANNLFKMHGEKLDEYFIDMQKRGVVNTSVVVGELNKLFDDFVKSKNGQGWIEAQYDKIIERGGYVGSAAKLGQQVKTVAIDKPIEAATKVYMAEDDFWKIIYYENQLKMLRAALPDVSDEVLKNRAAYIVKNTMPNYDLISPFFKKLRVLPFGNFFSFRFEEIRTTFNMYAMALDEIASDNPKIQAMGMRRLTGANVVAGPIGIGTIGSEASKLVNGITDEQDLAIHELENEWSRYSSKFYSTDEKGNIYAADTTYTDPYTDIHRFMVRLAYDKMSGKISGEEFQKEFMQVLVEEVGQLINPFVATGISAAAIDKALISQKDDFGRELYIKEDPDSLIPVQMQSRKNWETFYTTLLGNTLVPGMFRNVNRIIEAKKYEGVEKEYKYDLGTELLANVLGIRSKKIEPENMFNRRIGYLNSVRAQTKTAFDKFVNEGDKNAQQIQDQYKRFLEKRMVVDSEIRMAVDAGYTLGLSYDTMNTILKDRNIKQSDREAFLLTSKYSPYSLTQNDIDNILKFNPELKKLNAGVGVTTLPVDLRQNISDLYQEYYGKHLIKLPYYSKERKKAVEDNILTLYPIHKFYEDWMKEARLEEGVVARRIKKFKGGKVNIPFTKDAPEDRVDPFTGFPYSDQMERLGFQEGGEMQQALKAGLRPGEYRSMLRTKQDVENLNNFANSFVNATQSGKLEDMDRAYENFTKIPFSMQMLAYGPNITDLPLSGYEADYFRRKSEEIPSEMELSTISGSPSSMMFDVPIAKYENAEKEMYSGLSKIAGLSTLPSAIGLAGSFIKGAMLPFIRRGIKSKTMGEEGAGGGSYIEPVEYEVDYDLAGYKSAVEEAAIQGQAQNKYRTGQELVNYLLSPKRSGLSKQEIDFINLQSLKNNETITPDEVISHIKESRPKLYRVQRSEDNPYYVDNAEDFVLDEDIEMSKELTGEERFRFLDLTGDELGAVVEQIKNVNPNSEDYIDYIRDYIDITQQFENDLPNFNLLNEQGETVATQAISDLNEYQGWIESGYNLKPLVQNYQQVFRMADALTSVHYASPNMQYKVYTKVGDSTGNEYQIFGNEEFGYTVKINDQELDSELPLDEAQIIVSRQAKLNGDAAGGATIKENVTSEFGLLEDMRYDLESSEKMLDDMSDKNILSKSLPTLYNQYESFRLPKGGSQNYREFTIHLQNPKYGQAFRDRNRDIKHFGGADELAHYRVSDRMDTDGKRVLFVEEIQSDVHAAGRKFKYESEGGDIPDYPYKSDWTDMVVRDIMKLATEEGYERVAFINASEQLIRNKKDLDITDTVKVTKIPEPSDATKKLASELLDFVTDFEASFDNIRANATGSGDAALNETFLPPLEDVLKMLNSAKQYPENIKTNLIRLFQQNPAENLEDVIKLYEDFYQIAKKSPDLLTIEEASKLNFISGDVHFNNLHNATRVLREQVVNMYDLINNAGNYLVYSEGRLIRNPQLSMQQLADPQRIITESKYERFDQRVNLETVDENTLLNKYGVQKDIRDAMKDDIVNNNIYKGDQTVFENTVSAFTSNQNYGDAALQKATNYNTAILGGQARKFLDIYKDDIPRSIKKFTSKYGKSDPQIKDVLYTYQDLELSGVVTPEDAYRLHVYDKNIENLGEEEAFNKLKESLNNTKLIDDNIIVKPFKHSAISIDITDEMRKAVKEGRVTAMKKGGLVNQMQSLGFK